MHYKERGKHRLFASTTADLLWHSGATFMADMLLVGNTPCPHGPNTKHCRNLTHPEYGKLLHNRNQNRDFKPCRTETNSSVVVSGEDNVSTTLIAIPRDARSLIHEPHTLRVD